MGGRYEEMVRVGRVSIVVVLVAAAAAHAQLTFTPRVSVTEEYNDNINLDRKNKMDDWITTVSPGATLEWYGQVGGLSPGLRPRLLLLRRPRRVRQLVA